MYLYYFQILNAISTLPKHFVPSCCVNVGGGRGWSGCGLKRVHMRTNGIQQEVYDKITIIANIETKTWRRRQICIDGLTIINSHNLLFITMVNIIIRAFINKS